MNLHRIIEVGDTAVGNIWEIEECASGYRVVVREPDTDIPILVSNAYDHLDDARWCAYELMDEYDTP